MKPYTFPHFQASFLFQKKLGGGLKYVLFSSLPGEMIQFDDCAYFSDGLGGTNHQLEKHLQHFVKNREAKKPSISAALNSASMAGSEAGEIHEIHGGTTFLVPIGSMYGIFTYMNGEKWPHEHGEM